MGNDQSQSSRPNQPSKPSLSRKEVEQLLEQQKKEYDRKLRELQIRNAESSPRQNPNPSVETRTRAVPVPTRNADHILAQQLQEFAQIAYKAASTSGTQSSAAKPNGQAKKPQNPIPNSVPSATQNTTRYSYTSDELRNIQSAQTSKQQLYPQLDNVTKASQPMANTAVLNKSLDSDFVFVNKNQNAYTNQSPKPGPSFTPGTSSSSHINRSNSPSLNDPKPSTSRVQPSAPPESALHATPPTSKSPFPKTQSPVSAIHNTPTSTKSPIASKPQPIKKKGDNFSCITCGNKYGLTIFQCSLGHSSCRDCKLRSEPCSICKNSIGDMRNIALETLIAEVKLTETVTAAKAKAEMKQKCPNHTEGCNYYCKTMDLDNHLKECPFREFDCPLHTLFGRCNWKGRMSQVAQHFTENHPENCQSDVGSEMYLLNVVDSNHNVYFIDLSPYNFLVHLKVDETERKVFMTVQLLGTQASASRWTYEIQVYNKREPRRKFVHTDICHSSSVQVHEIFGDMKCATLPLAYALTFINEGSLTYKFYIKKDYDDSASRGKFRGRGRGRGRGAKDQQLKSIGENAVNNQAADSDQACIVPMCGSDANGEDNDRPTAIGLNTSSSVQLENEFEHLELKIYLLMALRYFGMRTLTKFQEAVLPSLLEDPPLNVIVTPTCGIGQSTAFVLALLNKVDINHNHPQVLYICSSDAVVTDIKDIIVKLTRFCSKKLTHVVMGRQQSKITEQIIIGTPARIIYGLKYGPFDMRKIKVFIADDLDADYNSSVDFLSNLLGATCQLIYLTKCEDTVRYLETKTPNCMKIIRYHN